MSSLKIFPALQNIDIKYSNIDQSHLDALSSCHAIITSALSEINTNFTSIDISKSDFDKIQEFKCSLTYIERRAKEINSKISNEELSLIDNFDLSTHKEVFKNTILKEIIIGNKPLDASNNWYNLTLEVSNHLVSINKKLFEDEVTKLSGTKKPYFSKDKDCLRRARKLKDIDYFIEMNFSAFETVCTCIKILNAFKFSEDVIVVFDTKKS